MARDTQRGTVDMYFVRVVPIPLVIAGTEAIVR